jgi:hypothetical protein
MSIKETCWIQIGLGYPVKFTSHENKNADLLKDFQISDLHFYCDTYDLTRPFPSTNDVYDYSEQFCWNTFLSDEFSKIGMRKHCCVLLQGLAQGKPIKETNGTLLFKFSACCYYYKEKSFKSRHKIYRTWFKP